MSFLSDYEQRTGWKYEPIQGVFPAHAGLAAKVSPSGSYASFPGSTVVFRPGKQCLRVIQLMQRVLDTKLRGSNLLADPLPASAIHLTLHDLISPDQRGSAPEDGAGFSREIADSLDRASAVVDGIRRDYAGRKITLGSDRIVNMVSRSLVLLLKPRTEEDGELLAEMYRRFDEIVGLPYPLTPHITLAYFRPGLLDGDQLGEAVNFAQVHPENAPVFDFYPEALTAQRFEDMQNWTDVPERICFCCDGGLNRSVMAACILNDLAKHRGLPVSCEARAAYSNTRGRPVPEEVWATLAQHGISHEGACTYARPLEAYEDSWFTAFAALTGGAVSRMSWIGVSEERVNPVSRFFYGVPDPEYGEVSYERAFGELHDRAVRFLENRSDSAMVGGEER